MDLFGKKSDKKIQNLEKLNKELQGKTSTLSGENHKMNSMLTSLMANFDGETLKGELGTPKHLVIDYETLRVRSWQFLISNHLANQIATKRVNWTIGKGLLFNAKPFEKPFLDYYKDKEKAKDAQKKFINDSEYFFRNFAKTKLVDYSGNKNLHEIAREVDFNAIGDGDTLLIARIKDTLPNIQPISGQAVCNPSISNTDSQIADGNEALEGVEYDTKGEVVAYHVLKDSNLTTGVIQSSDVVPNVDYGTKRVKAYFSNTKLNSAWLYMQSDLKKLGETRAMPLLSHVFESLKHLNDYLIANAKNAQLLAQMVISFEKTKESDGKNVFNNLDVDILGDTSEKTQENDGECISTSEHKVGKNGVILDLPKGVQAKILNPQSQANQEEYLKSTLQTIASATGFPYEVLISSYNSNYTASMGARSDFQFNLDVLTEMVPANQLYKKVWDLFIYTQVLTGKIDCPPLVEAYNNNDIITIQAITNATFEGTKIKPIDPLKFIKSLREQLPESIRNQVSFNTLENLVNSASNLDYEGVNAQVENEIDQIPDNFKVKEEPQKTE